MAHHRKYAVRILAALLCAAVATGCGSRHAAPLAPVDPSATPVPGGTLIVVGAADVDHLATTSAYVTGSLWTNRTFARQLLAYPPATTFDAAIALVPDVASEVPTRENGGISPDRLTYTFHLKPNVRWNSRPVRPVVAGDFVRAFKLFCNPVSPVGAPTYYTETIRGMAAYCTAFVKVPGTVSGIRNYIEHNVLVGVHAPDDATVVFELVAPAADFLNLVSMPFGSAVPVEYLDYLPDSPEFRQHTLSDGPYYIARYIQNRAIELGRNPAWDPRSDAIRQAYVDRIHIKIGIDAELAQLQVEAGTADLVYDETMLTANLASLMAIGDRRVNIFPPGQHYGVMHYLVLNTASPNQGSATAKLAVRQAIAMAVDKRTLVQLSGGPGVSRPLYQGVLSSVSGFRDGADHRLAKDDSGDPQGARKLLAAAGYPEGLSLRMAYSRSATYPIEAQALQASLARAGINVSLTPYPASDLFGRLLPNSQNARRGEWDLALTGWLPDWFGASNGRSVISPLFDGRQLGHMSQNFGLYSNPRTDAAIDRALSALTIEQANAGWFDAVNQVMDDVAIVPLIEHRDAYMSSSRIRNCRWSVFGMQCDMTALWLDGSGATTPGPKQ